MERRETRCVAPGAPRSRVLAVVLFSLIASIGTNVRPAAAGENGAVASTPSDTLDLAGLQGQFERLSARLAPSVVAISATSDPANSVDLLRSDRLNADQLAAKVFDKTTRIVGTGFVIDAGGYLLTNEHVIAEAEQLWVTTDDRKVYPAIVVGSDPRSDLAVLKIPVRNMTPVKFAKAAATRGQWSIALGNPYGLASDGEICMSVGIVSGVNRSLPKLASSENRLYSNLIQTTAEINPGNSGGPLFDLNGEVIGINTAVVLPHRQTNGIGFAIATDGDVMRLVRDLKDGREIVHGSLGVTVSRPTPANLAATGLTGNVGARVDGVEANSPAMVARLEQGDIVSAVDGVTVRDGDHLVRRIALADVERPVVLKVHRNGKVDTVSVTLRPTRPTLLAGAHRSNQRLRWGGLLIGPLPGNWSPATAGGVMVLAINKTTGAIPDGVAPGAIIATVAGKPINSLADLQQVINDTPAEKCAVVLAEPRGAVKSVGRD